MGGFLEGFLRIFISFTIPMGIYVIYLPHFNARLLNENLALTRLSIDQGGEGEEGEG
jgi:hypothetical protein